MGLFDKKKKRNTQPTSNQGGFSTGGDKISNQSQDATDNSVNNLPRKKGLGKRKPKSKQPKSSKGGFLGFGAKKQKSGSVIDDSSDNFGSSNAGFDSNSNNMSQNGMSPNHQEMNSLNNDFGGDFNVSPDSGFGGVDNGMQNQSMQNQSMQNNTSDMPLDDGSSGAKKKKGFGFGKSSKQKPAKTKRTKKTKQPKQKAVKSQKSPNNKKGSNSKLMLILGVLGVLIIGVIVVVVMQFLPSLMSGSKITGSANPESASIDSMDSEEMPSGLNDLGADTVEDGEAEGTENISQSGNTEPEIMDETDVNVDPQIIEEVKEEPVVEDIAVAEEPQPKVNTPAPKEPKADVSMNQDTPSGVQLGVDDGKSTGGGKMSYEDFLKETEKTIYRQE